MDICRTVLHVALKSLEALASKSLEACCKGSIANLTIFTEAQNKRIELEHCCLLTSAAAGIAPSKG